jgi:hypothetical protein
MSRREGAGGGDGGGGDAMVMAAVTCKSKIIRRNRYSNERRRIRG